MVIISNIVNKKLIEVCEHGFPFEVCGYLLGNLSYGEDPSGIDDVFNISELMICENINKDRPDIRFEINPVDRIKAQSLAESKKIDVIGVYHSHPNHKAYASPTDNDFAVESTIYLIYSIFDSKYKDLKAYFKNSNTQQLESTEIKLL